MSLEMDNKENQLPNYLPKQFDSEEQQKLLEAFESIPRGYEEIDDMKVGRMRIRSLVETCADAFGDRSNYILECDHFHFWDNPNSEGDASLIVNYINKLVSQREHSNEFQQEGKLSIMIRNLHGDDYLEINKSKLKSIDKIKLLIKSWIDLAYAQEDLGRAIGSSERFQANEMNLNGAMKRRTNHLIFDRAFDEVKIHLASSKNIMEIYRGLSLLAGLYRNGNYSNMIIKNLPKKYEIVLLLDKLILSNDEIKNDKVIIDVYNDIKNSPNMEYDKSINGLRKVLGDEEFEKYFNNRTVELQKIIQDSYQEYLADQRKNKNNN